MKISYEQKDINPGQRYGKPGVEERWIVGYSPGAEEQQRYAMISLADGIIASRGTRADIADTLSDGEYLPAEVLDRVRGA